MAPTTHRVDESVETQVRPRTTGGTPRGRAGRAAVRDGLGRSARAPYRPPSPAPGAAPERVPDPVGPAAGPLATVEPAATRWPIRSIRRAADAAADSAAVADVAVVTRAAAAALGVAGLTGLALRRAEGSVLPFTLVAVDVALVAGFLPGGLVVLRRSPRDPRAWLLAATGVLALFALASAAWSGSVVGAWLAQWTWWPPLALLPVLLLCLPDVPTRLPRRRWLDVAAIAGAAGAGCLMVAAAAYPRVPIETVRAGFGGVDWVWASGWAAAASIGALASAVAMTGLIRRGHRDRGIARRAPAALIPALVAAPVGAVLAALGIPGAGLLPLPVLGASVAVLLLPDPDGHDDRRWRRVLVGTCSGAGVFLLLVAGWVLLRPVAQGRDWVPGLVAVLAAGCVGGYGARWHAAAERLVARILSGPAHDPFRALRDPVPEELTGAGPTAPPTVAGLVEAVTVALRLRGARIRAVIGADFVVVAESGRVVGDPLTFPIAATDGTGRVAAVLEVAPGPAGRAPSQEHVAVLRRVTRLAAVAVDAERPGWEADRARAAVVARREGDRRRLREELHGVLWPAVSGCRVDLESARRRIPERSVRAGGGAAAIAGVMDDAIDDLIRVGVSIQDLMDELRPDGLDEGLASAVRAAAERTLPGAIVEVDLRGDLSEVPDEVEVAAYRIVGEALRWVARRPDVHHACVRVDATAGRQLELVVIDDGLGSTGPSPAPAGVADPSAMWTWAQEVGGRVNVLSSNTGTRVGAILPYAATSLR